MKTLSIIALLILAAFGSLAQTAPTTTKPAPPDLKKSSLSPKSEAQKLADARIKLAVDLLKQSHALNDQLDDSDKIAAMRDQVKYAVQADKDLGVQWANELFGLGSKVDFELGSQAQKSAISALYRADPEQALVLLEQIDPRILAPGWAFDFRRAESQEGADRCRENPHTTHNVSLR